LNRSSHAFPAAESTVDRGRRAAKLRSQGGAAFLLLLAALVLLGLSAGWGISFFHGSAGRDLTRRTERSLDEIRRALFIEAKVNGVLPPAGPDTELPAASLGIRAKDEWGRSWKYQVDPRLLASRQETCESLKTGDWSGTPVAVLASDGAKSDGDSSDDLVVTLTRDQLYDWLKDPAAVNQTPFNWTTCTISPP